MKMARFWTRDFAEAMRPNGTRIRVRARGWSDDSLEAARRVARDVAQRIADAVARGQIGRQQYLYGDRPLPEPMVREIGNAVVTRNSYGALVLNTQNLMFIDIDREDQAPQIQQAQDLVSSVLSMFRKPAAAAPPPAPARSVVVDDIERVARQNGLAMRVYRTAAGYRAMVTNLGFEPAAPQTEALLRQFGADELYIRLCRAQESFRARLSPKPWRCGLGRPAFTYPYTTPDEEARAAQWIRRYNEAVPRWATCKFVATVGASEIAPAFADLVAYHDRETRAGEAILPLA